MKRLLLLLLALALLLPALPFAVAEEVAVPAREDEVPVQEEGLVVPEGFEIMAENDQLALLLKQKNMLLRVVDKKNGRFLETSMMEGKQGNQTVKNLQKAMLNLTFVVNRKVGTVSAMDSYSLGVQMGSTIVSPLENGFRLRYEVGDTKLTVDDLPKMVPVEKYNELLLPYLSSTDEKRFRDNYFLVGDTQWVRTKDEGMGALIIKALYSIFYEKAKYTKEDLEEDNLAYGYEKSIFNPHVGLDMDFVLDGSDLVVSVDIGTHTITPENDLQMVEVLPYFMSATTENQGYFLVPDGPGGLIPFNSGNITSLSYLDQVYGADPLKNTNRYQTPKTQVQLPVYGMVRDDLAALAIIEEGAPMAELFADISGRADEFNRASVRFVIRDIEAVSLVGNQSITVPRYGEDLYEGKLQVRYKLFFDEGLSYVQLAQGYRQYLIDKGDLQQSAPAEHAPVFVEALGAFAKQKFFLGIPYRSTVTAGTLSQTGTMYDALKDKGLQNIHLSVYGLLSGGMKHNAITGLNLDGNQGGLQAWNSLRAKVQGNGDALAPSLYMNTVFGRKGFNVHQNAVRLHNGNTASALMMSEPLMLPAVTPYESFYVSVHALPDYVKTALNALSSLQASGLVVRDSGKTLVGDYARRKHVSPIHAVPIYQQVLAQMAAQGPLYLMRPNAYALPYADYALDLPTYGNGYKVVETTVPFLPLVLEGCVQGACSPINLAIHINPQLKLLSAMEARLAPAFTISYEPETVFHNTQDKDFMSYFGTQYQNQLDQIADLYQQYDAFYQKTKEARTLSHEILNPSVRKITYDNGVVLLLNFGTEDYRAPEGTVEGGNYLLIGG